VHHVSHTNNNYEYTCSWCLNRQICQKMSSYEIIHSIRLFFFHLTKNYTTVTVIYHIQWYFWIYYTCLKICLTKNTFPLTPTLILWQLRIHYWILITKKDTIKYNITTTAFWADHKWNTEWQKNRLLLASTNLFHLLAPYQPCPDLPGSD